MGFLGQFVPLLIQMNWKGGERGETCSKGPQVGVEPLQGALSLISTGFVLGSPELNIERLLF